MNSDQNNGKKTVAIAGASGFIGKWFIEVFQEKYDIVALSRRPVKEPNVNVEWRTVDLYSLGSITDALRGVDVAIYLVHSMTPSSSLNQAKFEDTDLLLADNFQKAAAENKLDQIIYVGGILPKDKHKWSRHLISRYEVEQTLGSGDVPLTGIRAGIIIGPGGSSFQILERLVKALPAMACPKWTLTDCQPIDIDSVLEILDQSIGNSKTFDRSIEVGCTDHVSYRKLIEMTAQALGKKRLIVNVPFFTIGLSKLWVSLFTKTDMAFISPLVESLKHQMTLDTSEQDELFNIIPVPVYDSIKKAVSAPVPKTPPRHKKSPQFRNVRSVQRMVNERGLDTTTVAFSYMTWLDKAFGFIVNVKEKDDLYTFKLFNTPILKLAYQQTKKSDNREVFFIVGGALAKRSDLGWLEFRSVLENKYVIAAIHEYAPRLPWKLYNATQALMHLWVMKRFAISLQR